MKGILILGTAFLLCNQSVAQANSDLSNNSVDQAARAVVNTGSLHLNKVGKVHNHPGSMTSSNGSTLDNVTLTVTLADESDVIFKQSFEPSQVPHDVSLETELPAYSSGFVSFSATATADECGVEHVAFYRDGSLFATDPTGSPYYTASLNSLGVTDGNHSFYAKVYDHEGHESSSSSISTFIDNTPPDAPGSVSASAATTSNISLSWSAAIDTGSGVKIYSVYRDGSFLHSTSALSFQDSNLSAGTQYCYTIKATDNLGNVGSLSTPACATTDEAVIFTEDWILISGDQGEGRFVDIATNDQEDVFGIGFLKGTADLGAGPITSYAFGSTVYDSVLVTRQTADGTMAWSKIFGTTGRSSGSTLAVTDDGGVVIGGDFQNIRCCFHLGEEDLASSSGTDGFIGKLDANGNHVWSFGVNGSGGDRISGVTVDTASNVLAIGTITAQADSLKEFSFKDEFEFEIDSNGADFIVKISAAGEPQWMLPIVGGRNNVITITPDDSFIVQGKFWGTDRVDISGQPFFNPNPDSNAAYVVKFSPSGDVLWFKTFNLSNPLTTIEDVALDADGDIYVVGSLINTMDVGGISISSNGSLGGFIFKLEESDGSAVFAKSFVSNQESSVKSISISPSGKAVLGGYFYGNLYIDGELHSSCDSYYDILIIETDLDGYVLESKSYNNSIKELVASVLLDNHNNYIIAGHFFGNLEFTYTMEQVSSVGGNDLFITKFAK